MKYNKTAIIGISADLIPYIENPEDERYGRLKNQLRQKIMGEIGCGITVLLRVCTEVWICWHPKPCSKSRKKCG